MTSQPTIGQLEREITQRIQALYNAQLGQRPNPVICHSFDREIVITLENSVTQVEQTLNNSGFTSLAEQLRLNLNKIIQPKIKDLIEEVANTIVLDVIINTSLTTGRTGIIVVLEQLPNVRNPQSIPKTN